MRVMKFGGTSVGDGARILQVADLVAGRRADPPLAVVSALGGVTDALVALSVAARDGERMEVERALGSFPRHLSAVEAMGLDEEAAALCRAEIGRELGRLGDGLTGISLLGECHPGRRTPSGGARSSSFLVTEALRKRGVAAVRIDPRELMITDANHAAAVPDEAEIRRRIAASSWCRNSRRADRRDGGLRRCRSGRLDDDARPGRLGLLGRALRRGAP